MGLVQANNTLFYCDTEGRYNQIVNNFMFAGKRYSDSLQAPERHGEQYEKQCRGNDLSV